MDGVGAAASPGSLPPSIPASASLVGWGRPAEPSFERPPSRPPIPPAGVAPVPPLGVAPPKERAPPLVVEASAAVEPPPELTDGTPALEVPPPPPPAMTPPASELVSGFGDPFERSIEQAIDRSMPHDEAARIAPSRLTRGRARRWIQEQESGVECTVEPFRVAFAETSRPAHATREP